MSKRKAKISDTKAWGLVALMLVFGAAAGYAIYLLSPVGPLIAFLLYVIYAIVAVFWLPRDEFTAVVAGVVIAGLIWTAVLIFGP